VIIDNVEEFESNLVSPIRRTDERIQELRDLGETYETGGLDDLYSLTESTQITSKSLTTDSQGRYPAKLHPEFAVDATVETTPLERSIFTVTSSKAKGPVISYSITENEGNLRGGSEGSVFLYTGSRPTAHSHPTHPKKYYNKRGFGTTFPNPDIASGQDERNARSSRAGYGRQYRDAIVSKNYYIFYDGKTEARFSRSFLKK